ncbi:MAG: PEP-CTERM sorting domain-containing protein [Rhodocyclaceae bacterium]|nr:PEP-CTERM sorting domain-containing protein [Rhodocyclaceae bacterium]
MIGDNNKRMRAVVTGAVLGLAVPLAALYWMWPDERPAAAKSDGMPEPGIPFSYERIAENETAREVVAASDFNLLEPVGPGEFTTDSGFGELVTVSTVAELEPEPVVAAGASGAAWQPGRKAASGFARGGIAGPSGGGWAAGGRRAPWRPPHFAAAGGGAAGSPPSPDLPRSQARVPKLGDAQQAFGDEPDILRKPAIGPAPQAVACAADIAGLARRYGEGAANDCEPGAQVGNAPAGPSIPSVAQGPEQADRKGGGKRGGDGGSGESENGNEGGQQGGSGTPDDRQYAAAGQPHGGEDTGAGGPGGGPKAGAGGPPEQQASVSPALLIPPMPDQSSDGGHHGGGGGPPQPPGKGGVPLYINTMIEQLSEPPFPEQLTRQIADDVAPPQVAVRAVPEPASLWLAVTALAGMAVARRSSRR